MPGSRRVRELLLQTSDSPESSPPTPMFHSKGSSLASRHHPSQASEAMRHTLRPAVSSKGSRAGSWTGRFAQNQHAASKATRKIRKLRACCLSSLPSPRRADDLCARGVECRPVAPRPSSSRANVLAYNMYEKDLGLQLARHGPRLTTAARSSCQAAAPLSTAALAPTGVSAWFADHQQRPSMARHLS